LSIRNWLHSDTGSCTGRTESSTTLLWIPADSSEEHFRTSLLFCLWCTVGGFSGHLELIAVLLKEGPWNCVHFQVFKVGTVYCFRWTCFGGTSSILSLPFPINRACYIPLFTSHPLQPGKAHEYVIFPFSSIVIVRRVCRIAKSDC
jgi:hypothetical protein